MECGRGCGRGPIFRSVSKRVSIALPVCTGGALLPRAIASVAGERDDEVLVVLNGEDAESRDAAERVARRDGRVRILRLGEANLARALNLALREASCELVARMDVDDESDPARVACQASFLETHPDLAGVGCAYRVVDGRGEVGTIRPEIDPARLRWRLLLRNDLAHGSMMLRRSAVLAAGGYDESLARAQDYDLWLRLSGFGDAPRSRPALGALPEVLYTYRVRETRAEYSAMAQARPAGEALARAWESLRAPAVEGFASALAEVMGDPAGPGAGIAHLEQMLDASPSFPALTAWLWARWLTPGMDRRALEVCRRSRLREVGTGLRRAGVRAVILWGAGAHAGLIIEHAGDLGVEIAGLVDDVRAGATRHGFMVRSPATLMPGEHVLLSSDAFEDELWASSASARARGVIVHRLYGEASEVPASIAQPARL